MQALENRAISFRRPLVCASTALALIPANRQEDIVDLIESGRLRWAWHIERAGSTRREIRIWGESIFEFLTGAGGDDGFDSVMASIFPDPGPSISAADLARAWATTSDHVLNLGRDGDLKMIQEAIRRPFSPALQFDSVREFFRKRRLS